MHSPVPKKIQGSVLFIIFILVFVASAAFFLPVINSHKNNYASNEKSLQQLQLAKEALLGYAAAHLTRQGSLPCPDYNHDGTSDARGGNCRTLRGWFPYRSLNIPEPSDTDGENFWYAVDNNFQEYSATTLDQFTNSAMTLDGNEVIAVIIAPGSALESQNNRNSEGGTANRLVSNYLEDINSNGNVSTYTSSGAADTYNDHVLAIHRDDLIPFL